MRVLALLALLLGSYQVQAYAVFAHFMVENAVTWSSQKWEADIVLAQQAHIDAFALNFAYRLESIDSVATSLTAAFAAANARGFKLLFSFDYAGGKPFPQAHIIDLLKQYGNNDAYFKRGSQPLVSTFEGPDSAGDWTEIKAQTGCFFMPDWSSLGARFAIEKGTADGLFNWGAWPYGELDMDTYGDASYLDFSKGRPYMMPASPWFYTNMPGYTKNWLWRSDRLWYDRWEEILWIRPEYVEIISWNDYGESHYIGPLHEEDTYKPWEEGKAPFKYAAGMPHDGWRDLLPYYIDVYKNGKASFTQEVLQVWYRTNPAAACSSGGTTANTASQLQFEFTPAAVLKDRVYFTALLASAASVSVTIGGVTQAATWDSTPDGGSGIYHGSVPFTGTGDVKVAVSGLTVLGKAITTSCTSGFNNFNAWVGSAIGTPRGAVSPSNSLSDLVCVKGFGANNFAGLCDFSCHYGFCPSGACVCTKLGLQVTKPKATEKLGYPVAGLSESYSGLCTFACNLGYCPEGTCGYTIEPLVNPTTSPFLPPTCTGGTGEGNLGGLCSYSCNVGYCPIKACTCTSTGPLNVPPPKIEATGFALPSLDSNIYDGLCDFACSRGYCPDTACMRTSDLKETTDGTCGAQNGGQYCGSWSGGSCCNANGACDWDGCGAGCQSGPCYSPTGYTPSGPVFFDRSIWGQRDAGRRRDISPLNMAQMKKRAVPNVELKCIPPCTLVIPPFSLATPTTIHLPALTTRMIQVYYKTQLIPRGAITVTVYEDTTVTITITRSLEPITATEIPYSNIIISSGTNSILTFEPSFRPSPVVVTDNTNPALGVTVAPSTRTITPLPYPQSGTVGVTAAPGLLPSTGTFTSAQPTSVCTGSCGSLCDPKKDPTLCIAVPIILSGGAGAAIAALLTDPVPIVGEPPGPGEDETCNVLTAYIYTKIISSYLPPSANTYSTVTNVRSEVTMGCDAHDSTTTTTVKATNTFSTVWEEATGEIYLQLGDDNSNGQDEAAASRILSALSVWAAADASTTTDVVEPRPTIVNGYPIQTVNCVSSTKWVTAEQMEADAGAFCDYIAGTNPGTGSIRFGSVGFYYSHEPTCMARTLYSAADCKSIFKQMAAGCTNDFGGVIGASVYAGCDNFSTTINT